jgi:hypothetical protein
MRYGYDFRASVTRNDGKTHHTNIYPTDRGARGEALRFLAGQGGKFDISYRLANCDNAGMLTGGESANVSASGRITH